MGASDGNLAITFDGEIYNFLDLRADLAKRGHRFESATDTEVLLAAFQKTPDSPRAPDLLLRLGMSLSGAGERETACRTFAEIDKRYTTLAPAFVTRLGEEKTRAECPPA